MQFENEKPNFLKIRKLNIELFLKYSKTQIFRIFYTSDNKNRIS